MGLALNVIGRSASRSGTLAPRLDLKLDLGRRAGGLRVSF